MAELSLNDEEIVLLDGLVRDDVQKEVDRAKARLATVATLDGLSPEHALFVASVVEEATESGLLTWQLGWFRHCPICKKSAGYAKFKSGPRRGEPNYDKPLTFRGVEMASRFVTIRGHVTLGGCVKCVDPLVPSLVEALRGVRAEIPANLRADGEPEWRRHRNRKCSKCSWAGHEGEMIRRRTLLGDGTYPAGCPSCGAENLPLGRSIVELVEGFTVVPANA